MRSSFRTIAQSEYRSSTNHHQQLYAPYIDTIDRSVTITVTVTIRNHYAGFPSPVTGQVLLLAFPYDEGEAGNIRIIIV